MAEEAIKVNRSIDDVLTKKQKETGRQKEATPKEKRAFVKNTDVHIQKGYLFSSERK